MIHVDRGGVAIPADLDGVASKGGKEMKECRAFYALKKNKNLPYPKKFVAYKSKSVVGALESLFFGKCAYCESKYRHLHPVDVEHYRPKGEVVIPGGRSLVPGYHWLAASWDNLLPSCIGCNRQREQEVLGRSGEESVGKGNLFPIADESKRAREPDTEDQEEPLLLNPCRHFPEEHLTFDDDGNVAAVLDLAGTPSRHGEASIEVLGLRRKNLVEDRKEMAIDVRARIKRIKKLERDIDTYPTDITFKQDLEAEVNTLKTMLEACQEYAAMVRQIFHRHYTLPR
jgi:uncharacterized protein (TIGR02646 family)